jgi:hypothetical protein
VGLWTGFFCRLISRIAVCQHTNAHFKTAWSCSYEVRYCFTLICQSVHFRSAFHG